MLPGILKRRIALLLLSIVAANLLQSHAQTIRTSGAPLATIDYQRLGRIDSLANEYVSKKWITGFVTLVVKDNQLVQYKAYGSADTAGKLAMARDAIFRIMSQTKALTSAGIMLLYEQGKLLLDEPVYHFIPEFKSPKVLDSFNPTDSSFTTVPARRDITLRDLLTHTSGIDYADIGSEKMKAIYAKAGIPSGLGYFSASLRDKMRDLARLPLVHQPGEKFTYGLNSDLLGCIIEIVSGTSLEVFLQKNFFEPLGMHDTYFNVPASKASRLPAVFTEDKAHHIIPWADTFRHINPAYPLQEKHYFSGGAGLSATAFDYAVFLQMILNGGRYNGRQILSRQSCKLMTSGQLDFLYNGKDNFGLGFAITSPLSAARNARSEGSFAWGGYYGTTYWADPKEHLVCLLMMQQTPNSHGDLASKLEALVYAALK